MWKVMTMFKKILAAGLCACALTIAPLWSSNVISTAEAAPDKVTMRNYPKLVGKTALSTLSDIDLIEAKRTAPELEEISDWNRQVAYYLGSKEYALTTLWSPLRVQLITPYSLIKYMYYTAGKDLTTPDEKLIDEIRDLKDVAWVWVWSSGSYNILNNNPPPTVKDIVIRTNGNEFLHNLDGDKYFPKEAFAAANIPLNQVWAFPVKVFSGSRIPFDIVLVDSQNNKKPLTINEEDLAKCQ